ncbi:unnamed protein product [Didymodactylos carnosus]|uniref:Uncharacterized protein n=2 Tax=Didymodactylos carnosus TaxID=1234261 RepID=A0A8S2YHD4_9BILA|nr:unnamed protein product [Didymodactylos carnosus]
MSSIGTPSSPTIFTRQSSLSPLENISESPSLKRKSIRHLSSSSIKTRRTISVERDSIRRGGGKGRQPRLEKSNRLKENLKLTDVGDDDEHSNGKAFMKQRRSFTRKIGTTSMTNVTDNSDQESAYEF